MFLFKLLIITVKNKANIETASTAPIILSIQLTGITCIKAMDTAAIYPIISTGLAFPLKALI